MNRRGFLTVLGAVVIAPLPVVSSIEPFSTETDLAGIGSAYARHLAQSMIETKETLAANVLNHSFLARYSHATYAVGFAITEADHG